jgi:hypothetical protein
MGMDHPQTSVATSFNYDIPIDKQIRLVAEAGFSHLSLGAMPEHSGYLEAERRRELKCRFSYISRQGENAIIADSTICKIAVNKN